MLIDFSNHINCTTDIIRHHFLDPIEQSRRWNLKYGKEVYTYSHACWSQSESEDENCDFVPSPITKHMFHNICLQC